MKNDKKKIGFSPTKKIFSAAAMLAVSASMLATSTYAWFSMNTSVTATGMKVQAKAEGGIVISNIDKSTWSSSADAKVSSAVLAPTSAATANNPTFIHASSPDADDAKPNQDSANYATLNLTWSQGGNSGIGYVDSDGNSAQNGEETAYVLLNDFYIKSSGEALSKTLYVNDVEVTGATKAVENSLRVLVVVTDNTTTFAKTYAPVLDVDSGTTTLSYKWKNTTNVTALKTNAAEGYDISTGISTIPNTDATAINAKVYIYFEGEDSNCKSTNISGITTNQLAVSVKFGTEATHNTSP